MLDYPAEATVPVVAIEPAIKPSASSTRSGVVGVLATSQTIASPGMARLMAHHGAGVRFVLQACPGLVEQVERGALDDDATRSLLHRYIDPLLAEGADTLVLGCTHYPFLADAIRSIAGPDVNVIDPAAAVARQLRHRLLETQASDAPAGCGVAGTEQFWSSGPLARAEPVMSALWGRQVRVAALPEAHARPA